MEKHNFHVTGCSHYVEAFENIAIPNHVYDWSNAELLDGADEGDETFELQYLFKDVDLVPEPENKYDPNAIAVVVRGEKIGYIKSASCTQVKNLLASDDFLRAEISAMEYGNVKRVVEDDRGKLRIKVDTCPPYAVVTIFNGEPEEKTASKNAAKKQARPKKKLSAGRIVLRIILTIIGLLLALLSIGAFQDTIVAGTIVLSIAVICLVIGWWPK